MSKQKLTDEQSAFEDFMDRHYPRWRSYGPTPDENPFVISVHFAFSAAWRAAMREAVKSVVRTAGGMPV